MSNYVKATNFATKDTLPTGDSNKIVKGTEIDNELNAISGAISSKADIASPTFTGTPSGPTASTGSSTSQLATTAFVTTALQALYPVGSVYINAASSTNPATLLGFGTWAAFGAGKVMVGLDDADTLFDTLEETGGSKDAVLVEHTHTVTLTDPGHTHTSSNTNFLGNYGSGPVNVRADIRSYGMGVVTASTTTTGITVSNSTEGTSATNANVQPFIVVKMWKRTA